MDKVFYTPREVAIACGMSYQTVIEQIRAGKIPCEKFGRIYKVPSRWIQDQTTSVDPVVIAPNPVAPPDYEPIATVLELLGEAMVKAAGALRGAL